MHCLETNQELYNAMLLSTQIMGMIQTLVSDGHSEIDYSELALFYEKINEISLKYPKEK